jgi:hypothetical protein
MTTFADKWTPKRPATQNTKALAAANDLLRDEKRKIVNAIWHCTDAVKLAEIKQLLEIKCS